MTRHPRQRGRRGGVAEMAGAAMVLGDAEADAGPRRHQRQVGTALGDAMQIGFGQRIDDGDAGSLLLQLRDLVAQRLRRRGRARRSG